MKIQDFLNSKQSYWLLLPMSPLCRVTALINVQFDITKRDAFNLSTKSIKPDIIVNTVTFTKADECKHMQDTSLLVNRIALGYLALTARTIGAVCSCGCMREQLGYFWTKVYGKYKEFTHDFYDCSENRQLLTRNKLKLKKSDLLW